VPNARFSGDGRRSGYYRRRIKKHLDFVGFGPRQRERIESAAWSKLRFYVHLLDRENGERWTAFAERTT
jgi:hypothetical protein